MTGRPRRTAFRLLGGAAGLAAAFLAGCEQESSRACPGFEGHPALADWAPWSPGDAVGYTSEAGATETYTLRAIEPSEPFVITEFGESEDIGCTVSVEYLFDPSSADHGLSITYSYFDRVGESVEDAELDVRILTYEGESAPVASAYDFRFVLTEPEQFVNTGAAMRDEASYAPMREIGQTVYRDVFERTLIESRIDPESAPAASQTGVVFARDAGLVRFERIDGQTFTRVPP